MGSDVPGNKRPVQSVAVTGLDSPPDSPALEVVQLQLPHVVRGRGHGHHPGVAAGGARLLQGVQEEVCQQKVAQVVDAEVLLKAVVRGPLRHHHHAGWGQTGSSEPSERSRERGGRR